MSPRDRVAQLYPQAPDSHFVAFYDSQGYDGGILTRLHTEFSFHSILLWSSRREIERRLDGKANCQGESVNRSQMEAKQL
jgi:hypothetical protein